MSWLITSFLPFPWHDITADLCLAFIRLWSLISVLYILLCLVNPDNPTALYSARPESQDHHGGSACTNNGHVFYYYCKNRGQYNGQMNSFQRLHFLLIYCIWCFWKCHWCFQLHRFPRVRLDSYKKDSAMGWTLSYNQLMIIPSYHKKTCRGIFFFPPTLVPIDLHT